MKGGSNMNEGRVMEAIKIILEEIGEDPNREGLKETPKRVMNLFKEIYGHTGINPNEELNTVFSEEHDEMVVVKDIPFHSTCEHHLIPFFGKVHIGYIPNGKIVGLSKLHRLVENTSRRLQVQERMTTMISKAIVDKLSPKGVIVVVNAEHLCISMRGIKKLGSITTTFSSEGVFKNDINLKNDFYHAIKL